MTDLEFFSVVVIGLAAGCVNTVAGGGSLISFPALLALGLPPLAANVTNTVGLVPGYLGGTVAYRTHLGSLNRGLLVRLAACCGVGGVTGPAILLYTPPSVFKLIVPFLIFGSAGLMLAQKRLSHIVSNGRSLIWSYPVVFVGGVYGAYFGAAVGVFLLAAIGIVLPFGIQWLNAIKALLSLVLASVAAVVYGFVAPVDWWVALVLGGSSLFGGHVGGVVAKAIPTDALRWVVVIVGFAVGAYLLVIVW